MSVAQVTARVEAAQALTSRKKKAASTAPKRTCSQLREEEDRLRKRREALEEKNKGRRKIAQERLDKRQKAEHAKMEARHKKELAELDDKYGCVPKPRKKGKGGKKGKRGATASNESPPGPQRQPPSVPTRPRQDAPVGTEARAATFEQAFKASTATIGDVLRAAYARARFLPWNALPEPSSDADLNERKAWTAVLAAVQDFDDEARYVSGMEGTAVRYLVADDAERASYPRGHTFILSLTARPDIILAADEVGFKVDKQELKDAKALLRRLQERGDFDGDKTKPLTASAWAKRTLQRLSALVGIKPPTAKKPASPRGPRKVGAKRKTAADPAAPAPRVAESPGSEHVGVFVGADPPPFKTWSPPATAVSTEGVFTDAELRDLVRKINAGTVGLEEYQGGFRRLLASKERLFALWEGQSKQALYPKNSAAELARYTKAQLVARKWDTWLRAFVLSDEPGTYFVLIPGKNRDPAENIRGLVEKVTAESLATYNARMQVYRAGRIAEIERKRARMADPLTLDDFLLLASERGEASLTPEQRIRFDELRAEATLEREAAERGNTARSITVPDVGKSWDVVETYHFRRDVPTWTVQKSTKGRDIPPDEFKRLNSAARALGGGWERFAKSDQSTGKLRRAVPGFLFWTREAAEKFLSALGGETVDNTAEVAARKARAADQRAAHLLDLGGRTEAVAEEALGRERLTNTWKRSTEAHHQQEHARAALALGESLTRIGEAISERRVKFLGHVQHRTQVEELDRLLRQAQYRRRHKEGRTSEDMGPPTLDDVAAVEYPYPALYGSVLAGIARDAERTPGFKLAAKAIQKLVRGKSDRTVQFTEPAQIELLRKLAAGPGGKRIAGELAEYDRVQAMRLVNEATLRAALREYLGCCKGIAPRESPVAALERGLIGRTFPGYFPTPRGLAVELVDLADIRAGHRVLEPSAGKGDIAAAIQAAAPASELVTIELQHDLAEILKDKGFTVAGHDFLAETQETLGTFDRIVANPPFENLADIDHVRHMWSFLRPGGRIVTVMSESPFFRQDKKATEFREWLEKLGGTSSKNPEGSFLASDRPTGVATRTVVLERRKK